MSENEIPAEEKSMLQEGLDALRKGELENAEEVFQEFLSRYPESKLADNACYNLAISSAEVSTRGNRLYGKR